MPRKTIEPEETAMLVLTKQEWELTRTELKLSPAMKKRFEAALVAEGEFNVLLTSKQIEKLLDAIIYKLDYDESVIDKRIWLDIFDKAHFLLEGDMDEDNAPEDSSHPIMQGALTLDDILMSLPEEVRKEFALEVKQNPPNSIDELQDFMQRVGNRINQIPDPEMGGLSPEQAHQLIYADWNDPDGPIRFKRDLTLAKLSNAEILLNARKFLTMLVEQDGKTKTTQSGYLTRVFVAEAMERFIFEEGYLETARKYNKVINETDIYPIHIIRIVLEFSSLLRKRKGAFHITRKGREMLREENAGELFTLLFITFFRKFNLTYLDRLPENPYLQHGVNYMLYRLGECARKWTDREDLALNLSLPKVQENAITPTGHNLLSSLVETRFLRPLMRFGLVERRVDDERILEYKCSYRVTPLYKAFLEIHV